MPTGTLTPKTQRQPRLETSAPPMVGPSASPMAWPAAWMPRAARILPGGALVVTRATLFACMSAAPTAWTTRKTTSTVRPGARPQAAEAAVKIAKP